MGSTGVRSSRLSITSHAYTTQPALPSVPLPAPATKRARQRMPLPHISGSLPSELKMRME